MEEIEWKTTKNPTCSKQGERQKVCKECKTVKEIETIATVAHNYVSGKCSVCGVGAPSDGLKFTLSEDGKSYILSSSGTCTDYDVVIPSTYYDENGKTTIW